MIRLKAMSSLLIVFVTAVVGGAQEVQVEAVVDVAVEAADVVVVEDVAVADQDAAEAAADAEAAQVAGEAVGEAIGGFFEAIAGGLVGRRARPARQVSDEAINKDVDTIESAAELRKLKSQLERHPNLQHMVGQLGPQLTAARNNELRLLHYACQMKRTEFDVIQKKANVAMLKAHVKAYQTMLRPRQVRGGAGIAHSSDPRTLLSNEVLAIANSELGTQRAKAYESELEAREAFRREAIVESMTVALDQQVLCSATQRERLTEVFQVNWHDPWLLCVQYLNGNGLRYFPEIPKRAIRSVLSQRQLDVFDSLTWQPQNVRFLAMNPNMFGMVPQGVGRLEDELEFAPEQSNSGEQAADEEVAE